MKGFLKIFGIGFTVVLLTMGVFAQDTMTGGDVVVIGDSSSPALQVVQDWLQSRDVSLVSPDAELFDPTFNGRQVAQTNTQDNVTAFYDGAFSDIVIQPMRYIVAGDTVVAEYNFSGVNSGNYLGTPATGAQVSVPIAAIYQVTDGQITSIRRYYDLAAFGSQMGYAPFYGPGYLAPPVAPGAPVGPVGVTEGTLRNVATFPADFFGEEVTLEGRVGEIVGMNGFILYERNVIGSDDVLVLYDAANQPEFIPVPDARVQVDGVVERYDLAALQTDSGLEVDTVAHEGLLDRYGQDMPVVVASSLTNLEHVSYIQNILDYPEWFVGKEVSFGGSVGEAVAPNAAFVYEDVLLAPDRILVIGAPGGSFDAAALTAMMDQKVEVQGMVRAAGITGLDTEFGLDLDVDTFAGYDGPVVLADAINPLSE